MLVTMKDTMRKLLGELLKNSKRSDRELAKIIGVSQPTVTRMRDKLEKMGMIREYTIIPDCAQMGVEIAAFTLVNVKKEPKLEEKAVEWLSNEPHVVFASKGSGLASNCLVVSLHENYTDFLEFVTALRSMGGEYLESAQSFVISFKTKFYKQFSFGCIEKLEASSEGE